MTISDKILKHLRCKMKCPILYKTSDKDNLDYYWINIGGEEQVVRLLPYIEDRFGIRHHKSLWTVIKKFSVTRI